MFCNEPWYLVQLQTTTLLSSNSSLGVYHVRLPSASSSWDAVLEKIPEMRDHSNVVMLLFQILPCNMILLSFSYVPTGANSHTVKVGIENEAALVLSIRGSSQPHISWLWRQRGVSTGAGSLEYIPSLQSSVDYAGLVEHHALEVGLPQLPFLLKLL
jgi:hypothetical protein